jgi:hypothetical protein
MNYSTINVAMLDTNLSKHVAHGGKNKKKESLVVKRLEIAGLPCLDAKVWLQIQSL